LKIITNNDPLIRIVKGSAKKLMWPHRTRYFELYRNTIKMRPKQRL